MKFENFLTLYFVILIFKTAKANSNNEEWNYDDPRWDDYIPNWWDEENFVSPAGPSEEFPKSFWENQGQHLLYKKITSKINTNRAKNLIIMVGDGMGLSSTMAARSYISDVNYELAFEKFPHTGMSKVYCVNYQVPDSACTATAFLTGIKNNFSVLGLTADVILRNCTASKNRDFQIDSIFKYAQDAGKSTGIVTTTRLTHATPAAAYAMSASRHWEGNSNTPVGCSDIAHQLIHGRVGRRFDVMLGGGRRYFEPTSNGGRRTDGRNLFNEYLEIQRQNRQRAAVVFARDHLNAIEANRTDRLFGVFSDSHMEYKLLANEELQPTLTEMTAKALEMLQKNQKNGFVMLVEGGRIDTSHHQNRAKLALEEVVEFNKAVEYVKNNTNEAETLILVTADHSHPFTIGGYLPRNRNILGPGDFSIEDQMWIFSAMYGQGQGNVEHTAENGFRKNPRGMNYMETTFRQPAAVPMDEGTHSGEDVGVYASGPFSHLFTGVYEQSFIAHAMMYATCLGPSDYLKNPNCR